MTIVGIDPGHHGAIVSIVATDEASGCFYRIQDMPIKDIKVSKKIRSDYDLNAIEKLINCWVLENAIVFIEKAQPKPPPFGKRFGLATSSISNFQSGYCRGLFRMGLKVANVRCIEVLPKEWQKHFGIVKPKDKEQRKLYDTKKESYKVASKLFPKAELTTPIKEFKTGRKVGGKILDGRADALLIGVWGLNYLKREGECKENKVGL